MNLDQVDVLGFSIGSFVAQEIALTRPSVVNRVVLASSAPKGAPSMHGWAADVIGAVGTPQTSPEEYISVFFAPSDSSRKSGQETLGRIYDAKRTAMSRRAGSVARLSTMLCANGGCRTTASSRGSEPSRCRYSSPTVTAIR